jgi:acyl-ACP thioesterase
MSRTWTETFRVHNHEAGPGGTVGIDCLAGWMQEAAGRHAAHLGFAVEVMAEAGLAWILLRLCLDIRRLPAMGEEVEVVTSCSSLERLLARRNYEMTAPGGEVLALGATSWAVMDPDARRLSRIPALVRDRYPGLVPAPLEFPTVKVPAPPRDDPDFVARFLTRVSDLDVNGHVNSGRLAGFMAETGAAHARGGNLGLVDAAFRAECRDGEEIVSRVWRTRDGLVHSLMSGDREVARGASRWKAGGSTPRRSPRSPW